jgi:hypothetical protein
MLIRITVSRNQRRRHMMGMPVCFVRSANRMVDFLLCPRQQQRHAAEMRAR